MCLIKSIILRMKVKYGCLLQQKLRKFVPACHLKASVVMYSSGKGNVIPDKRFKTKEIFKIVKILITG